MSRNTGTVKPARANVIFPAIFFLLFGLIFLEAFLFLLRLGILAHALILLLTLSYLAALRLRYRRTVALKIKADEAEVPSKALTTGRTAWFILMLMVGYAFAGLVIVGLAMPMVVIVISAVFLPWARVCSCNRDYYISGLLLAAGAAYPVLAAGAYGTNIALLIAGWALWMGACIAFFRHS